MHLSRSLFSYWYRVLPFTESREIFTQHLRTLTPLYTWVRPIWDLNVPYLVIEKEEIWLSPMIKATLPTEHSKNQSDNIRRCQNTDYTTVADPLKTVCWSIDSHPTGVLNHIFLPPSLFLVILSFFTILFSKLLVISGLFHLLYPLVPSLCYFLTTNSNMKHQRFNCLWKSNFVWHL